MPDVYPAVKFRAILAMLYEFGAQNWSGTIVFLNHGRSFTYECEKNYHKEPQIPDWRESITSFEPEVEAWVLTSGIELKVAFNRGQITGSKETDTK